MRAPEPAAVRSGDASSGRAARRRAMLRPSIIHNPDETRARLMELRALGVQLALDDFGSDYSSLSYLQKLPFDKLKIDRGFVAALDRSANGGVIIHTIVALGRALGMGVVIEGVETGKQRVLAAPRGLQRDAGLLVCAPQSTRRH